MITIGIIKITIYMA